jgi:PAS domain S-box-containing protein
VLAVPGIRADGATVSLEFTVTLLKDSEGRTSGIVAVMRDVTRRFEEAKALAQADAAAGAPRGQGKP